MQQAPILPCLTVPHGTDGPPHQHDGMSGRGPNGGVHEGDQQPDRLCRDDAQPAEGCTPEPPHAPDGRCSRECVIADKLPRAGRANMLWSHVLCRLQDWALQAGTGMSSQGLRLPVTSVLEGMMCMLPCTSMTLQQLIILHETNIKLGNKWSPMRSCQFTSGVYFVLDPSS